MRPRSARLQEKLSKAPINYQVVPRRKRKERKVVPDKLQHEDGTIFYPCKDCCIAFASETDLRKHYPYCLVPDRETTGANGLSKHEEDSNNNEPIIVPETKQENCEDDSNKCFYSKSEGSITNCTFNTKEIIVKKLSQVLEPTGISLKIQPTGEIVIKVPARNNQPELELSSVSSSSEVVQINIKSPHCDKNNVPELSEIIQNLFGADPEIENFIHSKLIIKDDNNEQDSQEIPEFELYDELNLKDPSNEAIVLEDLDIHICKQCGSVYHTLEDLLNHDDKEHRKLVRRFTEDEIAIYTNIFNENADLLCPICGIQLKYKCDWSRHMPTHLLVGSYACRICNKRFRRDNRRKAHEKLHIIKIESDVSE